MSSRLSCRALGTRETGFLALCSCALFFLAFASCLLSGILLSSHKETKMSLDTSGFVQTIQGNVALAPTTTINDLVTSTSTTTYVRPTNDWAVDVSMSRFPGTVASITVHGRNDALSTTDYVPITTGGTYMQLARSSGLKVRVRAGGNAADTLLGAGARTILVSGLEDAADLPAQGQVIDLAGASASSDSAKSFVRITGVQVEQVGTQPAIDGVNPPARAPTGDIILEDTSGQEVARVLAGSEKAQIGCLSVSGELGGNGGARSYLLTSIKFQVESNQSADFQFLTRDAISNVAPEDQGAFLPRLEFKDVEREHEVTFDPPFNVGAGPSDFMVVGRGALANTGASVTMTFLRVENP